MSKAAYLSPDMRRVAGETLRPGGLLLTDKALEVCRFPTGSRLLDVGCGPGATLGYLTRHHAMDAMGTDRSFDMLSRAAHASAGSMNLVQADGASLPFRGETMDGIFCECVLSLMADPFQALSEWHRLLRPEGRLVVSDLYLRRGPDEQLTGAVAGSSCLAGARKKEPLTGMVREAGFSIKLWEDHTPHLTQLAMKMIFDRGSLDWFYDFMGDGPALRRSACRSKPGYFLMVAVKPSFEPGVS